MAKSWKDEIPSPSNALLCVRPRSTGSTLGEELANCRTELNGDLHRGVIDRLVGRLVLGDGLFVGPRLIVPAWAVFNRPE